MKINHERMEGCIICRLEGVTPLLMNVRWWRNRKNVIHICVSFRGYGRTERVVGWSSTGVSLSVWYTRARLEPLLQQQCSDGARRGAIRDAQPWSEHFVSASVSSRCQRWCQIPLANNTLVQLFNTVRYVAFPPSFPLFYLGALVALNPGAGRLHRRLAPLGCTSLAPVRITNSGARRRKFSCDLLVRVHCAFAAVV